MCASKGSAKPSKALTDILPVPIKGLSPEPDSPASNTSPTASAAPAPAPPYDPGPYGPRIKVTTAPASTEMPNAGGQATASATETLQVPAAAQRRSRGSYRTTGVRGLSIPGAI